MCSKLALHNKELALKGKSKDDLRPKLAFSDEVFFLKCADEQMSSLRSARFDSRVSRLPWKQNVGDFGPFQDSRGHLSNVP